MTFVLLAVRDAGGVKATTSGNFIRKFVGAMVDPLLEALSYGAGLARAAFPSLVILRPETR